MKNFKLLSVMASVILGVLFLFNGINFVQMNDALQIVIGVFLLLFGAGHITFSILLLSKSLANNEMVKKISDIFLLSTVPLYYFLSFLSVIITAPGLIGVGSWIIDIIILSLTLSIVIFAILAAFVPNALFAKVKDFAILGFLAMILLEMVFPQGGGLGTIGNVTLFELVLLVCYALLAYDSIKDTLGQAKDVFTKEETKEEKQEEVAEVKEVPAEEVQEETSNTEETAQ